MAKLYVVDVPLDCPEDLTLRALGVLEQVSLIVIPGGDPVLQIALTCLLAHHGVQTRVCAAPPRSVEQGVHIVLDALAHGDVAWVWHEAVDAPEVAWRVLSLLCERGVDPTPIPGPSMAASALAISGLPTVPVVLLGPLPTSVDARRATLRGAAHELGTVMCTVPAGSLAGVLNDCLLLLGDRQVALWHAGATWRGRTSQAPIPSGPGPITVVIGGAVTAHIWNEEQVREQVRAGLAGGKSARDVARDIAGRSGWSRKMLYAIATEVRSQRAQEVESR